MVCMSNKITSSFVFQLVFPSFFCFLTCVILIVFLTHRLVLVLPGSGHFHEIQSCQVEVPIYSLAKLRWLTGEGLSMYLALSLPST